MSRPNPFPNRSRVILLLLVAFSSVASHAVDYKYLVFIHVRRSVWRKHTTDPKNEKSRAAVPVIPQVGSTARCLASVVVRKPEERPDLPKWCKQSNQPHSLYWRKMREVLQRGEIEWSGWHGFRRGLASNLNLLRVDDSVIQAILRHSHIGVMQNCYIKTVRPDVEAAMRQFSEHLKETCSQVVLEKGVSEPSTHCNNCWDFLQVLFF